MCSMVIYLILLIVSTLFDCSSRRLSLCLAVSLSRCLSLCLLSPCLFSPSLCSLLSPLSNLMSLFSLFSLCAPSSLCSLSADAERASWPAVCAHPKVVAAVLAALVACAKANRLKAFETIAGVHLGTHGQMRGQQ
jgi:hypothetical protein